MGRRTAACGFFAHQESCTKETMITNCAMYSAAGACKDDNLYPKYNAYRMINRACKTAFTATIFGRNVNLVHDNVPSHTCKGQDDFHIFVAFEKPYYKMVGTKMTAQSYSAQPSQRTGKFLQADEGI